MPSLTDVKTIHYNDMEWKKLGEGSFNFAYLSPDQKTVLKIPKHFSEDKPTDAPKRAVRLWNELNPQYEQASVVNTGFGVGWICPFVAGKQASSTEIHLALIDIYNASGRIVLDALSPKNFLKIDEEVICIDVGFALHFSRASEDYYLRTNRCPSPVSELAWGRCQESYTSLFKKHEGNLAIDTISSLVFIAENRPDIVDVSFLKNNADLIKQLARAQQEKANHSLLKKNSTSALEALEQIQPLKINQIKADCIAELQDYINARGQINWEGFFEPSKITKMVRNEQLTISKVNAAEALVKAINVANSIVEIEQLVQDKLIDLYLTKSNFKSAFATRLSNCQRVITTSEENPQLDDSLDSVDLNSAEGSDFYLEASF